MLAFTSVTAASASTRRVEVLDDCEPASFDAALQNPNACVKDGGTTFDEFIGQLVSIGRAPAWRFAPGRLALVAGGSIDAYSRGGVPECANAGVLFANTGIAPGGELEGAPLPAGTHRFECLIHAWMPTTVQVGG